MRRPCTLAIPLDAPLHPHHAFATLPDDADALLLHSGVGDPQRGQRSLLALELEPAVQLHHDRVELANERGHTAVLAHDPSLFRSLDAAFRREVSRRTPDPADAPPTTPSLGWVGYMAWEAAPLCDTAMPRRNLAMPFPLARFDRVRAALLFPPGPGPHRPTLIVEADDLHAARARAQRWIDLLASPAPAPEPHPTPTAAIDGDPYRAAVRTIREHIRNGRVYQACLTTPLPVTPPPPGTPRHALARHLADASPGDFSFRLRMGPLEALSTSPEQFLRVHGHHVIARPMKGTRPRPDHPDDLPRLVRELATSEKDRAENLMIVDLMRNDLNRVCLPGSVRVPTLFEIEHYASVLQMTSTIEGTLAPGIGPFQLLQATFPPGSMSGAPKIEACHVLNELEDQPRGLYGGTVGWLGYDHHHSFGVVIRTLQIVGDEARWDIGGGIVHDSDPDDEWREALSKAAAILKRYSPSGGHMSSANGQSGSMSICSGSGPLE